MKCFPPFALAVLAVGLAVLHTTSSAAEVMTTFGYRSSVSSDSGGPLDLLAELNYDNARTDAPIAVVMHGYSPATGNFGNVRANAQRLRDAGFFVVSVAMRGRDGSDGIRDSGGLEIYDIYDAVEAVKSSFAEHVDPTNVHITGYSGGGGNAMSALTKFPDYFRAGSSYFGISDYGYDTNMALYQNTATTAIKNQLTTDVGNPLLGSLAVLDRYMARASNLASRNNPYSEIHLFVNSDEEVCPAPHITTYRDFALAHASEEGEFDNIHVHIGQAGAPVYQDFDGDSHNDANELQWWPHGFPTANQQASAEGWYLDRLLNGDIPEPELNDSDTLFVAGFVKTKKFELRLGNGQNAAGLLDYELSPSSKRFALEIESSSKSIGSALWIETSDMTNSMVDVFVEDAYIETIQGGARYRSSALRDGLQLELRLAIEGDYNKDGTVSILDYQVWREAFGSQTNLMADGNYDGIVDAGDYTVWRNSFGNMAETGQFPTSSTIVPEPRVAGIAAMGLLSLIPLRRQLFRHREPCWPADFSGNVN